MEDRLKNCPNYTAWKVSVFGSFSGPCFPAFRLNTEICFLYLYIQSECGKIRAKNTPNTDTFREVLVNETTASTMR